jgi:hypothetical protein
MPVPKGAQLSNWQGLVVMVVVVIKGYDGSEGVDLFSAEF